MTPSHNCSYCNQLVPDGDPYCGKCGGPQTFASGGNAGTKIGAVHLNLDPWIVTATPAKDRFAPDGQAVRALVNTWRNDPDHVVTREIVQEINDAQVRGSIMRTESYYFCCPWSPTYRANRDVTIGKRRIAPGQQFAFDVSAEAIPEGGHFKREVLIDDFSQTDKIDYCLPGQGGKDD